jgi:citrate lyase beta subunit
VATTLKQNTLDGILEPLAKGNAETAREYPVSAGRRQPVHTVYGGAHLFKAGTTGKLGQLALKSLEEYGPDPVAFAKATGITEDATLAKKIYSRMVEKLRREPVEDFRIDFEDGYGNRPDEEEDKHAEAAAREVALGMRENSLPPFIGIRIKPLSDELCRRSLRTLDLFLTTLIAEGGKKLPQNFVVTLPKIMNQEQVFALTRAMTLLEKELGLEERALKMEFMVETHPAVIAHDGRVALPQLLAAAGGRCIGAHLGTYDYTASCDITANYQEIKHPACDFAKDVMQVALLTRGLMLSDGATNVMPTPRHRPKDGQTLTGAQMQENRDSVVNGWRLHAQNVKYALARGYYQGWDLHPAQLPTRYAAVYGFFLEGFDSASKRLKNFVEQAAQATLIGDVFDDAATGQGLLNFFLRGISCGAFSIDEAAATGLTHEEIQTRSFLKILAGRRK